MKIENENTFRASLGVGLNLFLGAGFSVLARNADGTALPVGDELKEKLVSAFSLDAYQSLDLPQLCTIIETSRADALRGFLEKTFRVVDFDPKYLTLDRLALSYVFSTNIDDLLYGVFDKTPRHYLNDVSLKGPIRRDKAAINYIALHGSIQNRASRFTFATTGIASAYASDPDLWHLLTGQMQQLPTLFWGYSLADAGVLQALSPATVKGRELKDKWIVLRKSNPAAEQYFHALRFNIIIAETSELLDYLGSAPQWEPASGPAEVTEKLFPGEAVPALGTGHVRPLLDFYLGDAPAWSDIYSGRLHKVQHFATIVEKIYGHRNALVIGIPACGKTTLLMQCAADVKFAGHKLVTSSLTEEKARHIVGKLNGQKAVVFVDDFTDSIGAVSYLMTQPNIIVIGFDREHNYEIVSHKLERSQFDLLDVTELSSPDVQEVFSRIPPEIRKQKLQSVQTQAGVQVSLFEVVEANLLKPTLKKRFAGVLQQLADEPDLRDLLVMIAYVHSCRTPVSFDMAYAFLRDRVSDYSEVYTRVERLGQLVSTYSGALIDGDQDHYVPRSVIVSEAIIEQVPGPVFRQVLEHFHKEISALRICRFDVFKRRAFDADFFGKAFPLWVEGKEFYDELYSRDSSPYLRQQGALYLAHKKRFHEAFAWIDEALLQSGGKIPSIRHSHAVILFNANIALTGAEGGEHVRAFLDQSMTILTECYRYDKRKSYHALTFADQALKYWSVFGDDAGKEYLRTALVWLEDEQKRSPWHRRVRALSSTVRDLLRKTGS